MGETLTVLYFSIVDVYLLIIKIPNDFQRTTVDNFVYLKMLSDD